MSTSHLSSPQPQPEPAIQPVSLLALAAWFLRLGALGFGGPVALAGAMERGLVAERRWISREEFLEGLTLAQLAPGPLAAQLAMYLGYVRGGAAGATVIAVAFVLPSFLVVWALAAAYVGFGGLPWIQSLFYGIGAAVIGIMAHAVVRLARLTMRGDALRWLVAAMLFVSTAISGREMVSLFVLGGLLPLVALRAKRSSAAPAAVGAIAAALPPRAGAAAPTLARALLMQGARAAGVAGGASLAAIAWFFTRAGLFVFGSGLAVVPFLYGGVVLEHRWLTERQFLDAVAVAMITPGPVVITVAFIGYLVRGVPGMFAAAMGIFVPVWLVVVLAAPWFRRYQSRPDVRAFVGGVTAAATGAIAGAVVVLGRRALVDPVTLVLAGVSFIILLRWRVPEPLVIAGAGVLGLCLH